MLFSTTLGFLDRKKLALGSQIGLDMPYPPLLLANDERPMMEISMPNSKSPCITALLRLLQLRMVRRGCARLILEDGVGVVYHCMDNSRVHHGHALR